MLAALEWLGLDWDELRVAKYATRARTKRRSTVSPRRVCSTRARCSRSEIAREGVRAPDGGWRYTGRCRERALPPRGWRAADAALRLRLPEGRIELRDESGLRPLPGRRASRWATRCFAGATARSPITWRWWSTTAPRESRAWCAGAISRRRPRRRSRCSARSVSPTPTYRHHFLLLEETRREAREAARRGRAVASSRARTTARPLCGLLAHARGPGTGPAADDPARRCSRTSTGRACPPTTGSCAGPEARSSRAERATRSRALRAIPSRASPSASGRTGSSRRRRSRSARRGRRACPRCCSSPACTPRGTPGRMRARLMIVSTHSSSASSRRLDRADPVVERVLDDVGDVLRLLVRACAGSSRVKPDCALLMMKQFGKPRLCMPCKRRDAVRPLLGERHAVAAVQLVAGAARVVGADLEAGGEDQAVELVLHAVRRRRRSR